MEFQKSVASVEAAQQADDTTVVQNGVEVVDIAVASPEAEKNVDEPSCVEVVVDHEALKMGFDAPFKLMFLPTEKISKGAIMRELVKGINEIRHAGLEASDTKKAEQAYRRWVCKMFSLPDTVFSSPDAFRENVELLADTLSAVSLKPSIQREDARVSTFEPERVAAPSQFADIDAAEEEF